MPDYRNRASQVDRHVSVWPAITWKTNPELVLPPPPVEWLAEQFRLVVQDDAEQSRLCAPMKENSYPSDSGPAAVRHPDSPVDIRCFLRSEEGHDRGDLIGIPRFAHGYHVIDEVPFVFFRHPRRQRLLGKNGQRRHGRCPIRLRLLWRVCSAVWLYPSNLPPGYYYQP